MKKVVTIGGGAGSYAVLRGLKRFPFEISAIVSMFDSGGSSGVLRDEMGILPPGDVRRCLVALSDTEGKEHALRELFNYRFKENGFLHGHSFGNLLLAALSDIYGSEQEAIRRASEILEIKGRVLPVSLEPAHLHAILENGEEVVGETNIDIPKHDANLSIERIFLEPAVALNKEADNAIREADIVVFCPGDLYTSLIPNLVTEGIREALNESKADMVYVCNLMTKYGETNGFKASDFAHEVLRYSGLARFDAVICHEWDGLAPELQAAYEKEHKYPVVLDQKLSETTNRIIKGDFRAAGDIVRHDSEKVAATVYSLDARPLLIFDLDDTLYDSSERGGSPLEAISLFEGADSVLSNGRFRKVLVTKGEDAFQRRKIELLGLRPYFDAIYIVPTEGTKGDVIRMLVLPDPKRTVVIGNRIDDEIRCGNQAGAFTILYSHGKYKHLEPETDADVPSHTVATYNDLASFVSKEFD